MAGRSRWPCEGPPFPLAFGLLDAGEVGVAGRRSRSASKVLDRLEREPRAAGVDCLGAGKKVNALPGFGGTRSAPRKAADRRKQTPRVTTKARKAKRVWQLSVKVMPPSENTIAP